MSLMPFSILTIMIHTDFAMSVPIFENIVFETLLKLSGILNRHLSFLSFRNIILKENLQKHVIIKYTVPV